MRYFWHSIHPQILYIFVPKVPLEKTVQRGNPLGWQRAESAIDAWT